MSVMIAVGSQRDCSEHRSTSVAHTVLDRPGVYNDSQSRGSKGVRRSGTNDFK